MSSKKEILTKLKQLSLSEYPYIEVHRLIQKLGSYAAIMTYIPTGSHIIRARPNEENKDFFKVCQISYKPQSENKTYQRASTPYKTMFYGSMAGDEPNTGIVISALETCKSLRDKSTPNGQQTLTFGKWVVTKPIPVLAIIHHKDYISESKLLQYLTNDYQKFLSGHSPETVQESLTISEFFADEFAKEITNNEYDYLISAIYSERATNIRIDGNKLAGVLYPSVKSVGKGINVAISPDYVNENLQLEHVLTATVHKEDNHVYLENHKIATVKHKETFFKLEPVKGEEHVSLEKMKDLLSK